MNWNWLNFGGADHGRRTVDAAGAVMCLALTGLLYAVGVHPMLEQRRERQALEQEVIAQRHELGSVTSTLMDVRRQYLSVQRAVADNALRLESLGALNRRVAELTQMAREAGLDVEGVRPGRANESEHYRTVPVQVNGRGSFFAIARFLSELHREMPDVGIWSLQLDHAAIGADSEPMFTVQLIWYAAPTTE